MSGKKDKPIDLSKVTPDEKMKYEIAEELGLLDQKSAGKRQIITEMLISMNFSCHYLQRNNPFDTIF